MNNPLIKLPYTTTEPLCISVNRNGYKESMHEVDVAVCDVDGNVVLGMGNIESIVFPRSAMKPLQTIALLETLYAYRSLQKLSNAEISLICGSHNGENFHINAVISLLNKFEISKENLICGAHWSQHEGTMIRQIRSMDQPHQIHNNCSGKHAGMLILSKLINGKTDGYAEITNEAQQKILGVLEFMTGTDLMNHAYGVDGCGAPVYGGPLSNWAKAFALFTGRNKLPEKRHMACQRIRESIAAEPVYIAGHGRACTHINAAYGKAITVKIGAEGVYSAAFHNLGLGAMVKTRDGGKRGAKIAIGGVIRALGFNYDPSLRKHFEPTVYNWAGEEVGNIKMLNLLT